MLFLDILKGNDKKEYNDIALEYLIFDVKDCFLHPKEEYHKTDQINQFIQFLNKHSILEIKQEFLNNNVEIYALFELNIKDLLNQSKEWNYPDTLNNLRNIYMEYKRLEQFYFNENERKDLERDNVR